MHTLLQQRGKLWHFHIIYKKCQRFLLKWKEFWQESQSLDRTAMEKSRKKSRSSWASFKYRGVVEIGVEWFKTIALWNNFFLSFAPPCYSENFIFHNQNSTLKQKWVTTPENCLIFHTNSCMTQLVDFSFLSPNKNRSCLSAFDSCSFVVPYWQEHTRNKNRICTQLFITFG